MPIHDDSISSPATKFDDFGDLAHLGERLFCKQKVVGSIPTFSTIFRELAKLVRHWILIPAFRRFESFIPCQMLF